MKKKFGLVFALVCFLAAGIGQLSAFPTQCFENCLMNYRDCQEIYGWSFCQNEFNHCIDYCN